MPGTARFGAARDFTLTTGQGNLCAQAGRARTRGTARVVNTKGEETRSTRESRTRGLAEQRPRGPSDFRRIGSSLGRASRFSRRIAERAAPRRRAAATARRCAVSVSDANTSDDNSRRGSDFQGRKLLNEYGHATHYGILKGTCARGHIFGLSCPPTGQFDSRQFALP